MKKIQLLIPGKSSCFAIDLKSECVLREDIIIDTIYLYRDDEMVSSRYDFIDVLANILKHIKHAECSGYDAVIIDGTSDFGVNGGRKLVNIPVLSTFNVAINVAKTLGERVLIVTTAFSDMLLIRKEIKRCNLKSKLVSILQFDLSENQYIDNQNLIKLNLCKFIYSAIRKNHFDTIILGSLDFLGMHEKVRQYLLNQNYNIAVIDAVSLTIHYANMLTSAYLSHSKACYNLIDS